MHQSTKPDGPGDAPAVRLDTYDNSEFRRGRSAFIEFAWIIIQAVFVSSFIPGSWHRRILLRSFGAKIGQGVVCKPHLRVKFPWKLTVGDHSWLGEGTWIDNLETVKIGSHCCISQEAYLCAGSHDWSKSTFNLIAKPIIFEDNVWIGARATVAPGVTAGNGSVLSLGSVANGNLEPWSIYAGVPATFQKKRTINKVGR